MSSNLYTVSPVEFPLSGNTDASGNLTLQATPRAGYWISTRLVGSTSGNALWKIFRSGTAVLMDFGSGPNVSIGPFLLAPKQDLTIQISGALPNTAVTAMLSGVQAPDLGTVTDYYQPQPGGSTPALSPRIPLGSLVSTGSNVTKSFMVPSGTHSVGFLTTVKNASVFTVTGHTSGFQYANTDVFLNEDPFYVIIEPIDTQIDISWTPAVAGTLYVAAAMDPLTVAINSGQTVNSVLVDSSGKNIDDFSSSSVWTSSTSFFNGLLITEFGSKAAPWQAAYSVLNYDTGVIANNANFVLVAGVAGESIYLHTFFLCNIGGAAANFNLFSGATQIAGDAAITNNTRQVYPFSGAQLPTSGGSLNITNTSGANIRFVGYVAFSQI